MNLAYLTYRSPLLQAAPKIHTDLLWDLTWLFLVLAVAYFGGVFYYRNRISAQSKKVGLRKTELSPIVSEFLFYEENATNEEKAKYIQLKVEIRQMIKDEFNRRVLSEVLLDLRKDVSGDTQKRLFELYKDLGLHKDAYKKLKSWKWHVVSKGILELTQMRVEESYSLITRFINDKRRTIRKQAEIATVTLKYEGINFFLDNTRFKISEWQQLKLLDVLRNFEDYQPPSFKVWLTSSNRNVVLFALRLIKYYNQNDAKSSLLELVKHKNNRIKNEAIKCLKEFYVIEASEVLKTIFWKSTVDIKILILDVLAAFGQEEDLDFLHLIDKKESNFAVKSKALSAINTIRPESILPTDGILDISGYKIPEDIVLKSAVGKKVGLVDDLCELPQPENASEKPPESVQGDGDKVLDIAVEEVNSPKLEPTNEVDQLTKTEPIPGKTEAMEEEKNDIRSIETNIEEVSGIDGISSMSPETDTSNSEDITEVDLQEIDLSFLPLIVDAEAPVDSIDELPTAKKEPVTPLTENEIFDLNVDYSEVEGIPVEKISEAVNEAVSENKEEKNSREETMAQDEKRRPESAKITVDITEIEVDFDELDVYQEGGEALQENAESEEKASPRFEIDEGELDFLPIVVEEATNLEKPRLATSKYVPRKHQKETSQLNLLDYEVHYDEVTQVQDATPLDVPSPYIAPVQETAPSVKDIDTSNLFDLEVVFEEISDIDAKEDILKEIPKIEFYSEETLQTMALLDDIEALGDHREIPLLLEYLEKSTQADIRNRIREIIKKFAKWEPRTDETGSTNMNELPVEYNVLEELFKNVDLEEKLILLDAVSDIVDKQDIRFLMKVKDLPEQQLRDKATIMIMEFEKRMSLLPKEEKQVIDHTVAQIDQEDTGIFKVDFEIALPTEKKTNAESSMPDRKKNSFLDQLLDFPNKIIDSLNG